MKAMIIDDEPLAHEVLLHHLSEHEDIQVVSQFYNATEALSFLAGNSVDLIFLDIKMPVLSGLDMLKVMANKPQVVLCTAYQDYALEGFELDVTDYLLKPVSAERFAQALDKVRRRAQGRSAKTESANPADSNERLSLIIRVDRQQRKIWLDEVECFESYGNYVKVWQNGTYVLTNGPLKEFIAAVPEDAFLQVHKSVLVNKQQVVAKGAHSLSLRSGREIKIGKSFKVQLSQLWSE